MRRILRDAHDAAEPRGGLCGRGGGGCLRHARLSRVAEGAWSREGIIDCERCFGREGLPPRAIDITSAREAMDNIRTSIRQRPYGR